MQSLYAGAPGDESMKYTFNASIRELAHGELALPIPVADVRKLRLLHDGNLIGERVRVEVEL